MFDIGWSEMAVVALVALIVIGPKDLPRVARNVGQWVAKGRAMGREFHRALEDMAREAELDKVKSEIEKAGRTDLGKTIEKTIDPSGELSKALEPPVLGGQAGGWCAASRRAGNATGHRRRPRRRNPQAASRRARRRSPPRRRLRQRRRQPLKPVRPPAMAQAPPPRAREPDERPRRWPRLGPNRARRRAMGRTPLTSARDPDAPPPRQNPAKWPFSTNSTIGRCRCSTI